MTRFLEVFIVGDLVSRSITCLPPYNRDKSVCITASHARSGVSKLHRYEYENLHSREYGGRQAMKEKALVFDKCGPLTLALGDNVIFELDEV